MPAPPPFVVNTDPERVAESQTALIVGIITTINFLAIAVVAARTYTRLAISKSPGAQDVLMVLSVVSLQYPFWQRVFYPAYSLTLYLVHWACGHHHPISHDSTRSG
jgi:hypothetical protein